MNANNDLPLTIENAIIWLPGRTSQTIRRTVTIVLRHDGNEYATVDHLSPAFDDLHGPMFLTRTITGNGVFSAQYGDSDARHPGVVYYNGGDWYQYR